MLRSIFDLREEGAGCQRHFDLAQYCTEVLRILGWEGYANQQLLSVSTNAYE
jgi:hypothetical protein